MLIGAIGLLLLIVVLCGYQIYQFLTGLRFILRMNFICKGIKLYLHEVPNPLENSTLFVGLNGKV
jgi:hypothetical protein